MAKRKTSKKNAKKKTSAKSSPVKKSAGKKTSGKKTERKKSQAKKTTKKKTAKKKAAKKKPVKKKAAKKKTAKKKRPKKKPAKKKPAAGRKTKGKTTSAKSDGKKRKPGKRKAKKRKADPAIPAIRVRMFRHGLGDCFLVTFDVGGDERHMLIDCGTLGKKSTNVNIDDIAQHLHETIGDDGRLNIVVATHEHQDHLSGFYNNDSLRALAGKVDHVWLAWTENPDDADARELTKYRKDIGEALAGIAAASPDSDVGMQVNDLMGFAGDMSLGPLGFAKTVNAAMEFVRTGLGAETTYHNPGDLIEESWLPGFRIYVLGPPRDKAKLKELGDHGSDELYGLLKAAQLKAAQLKAAQLNADGRQAAPSDEERAKFDLEQPFDSRFLLNGKELKQKLYPEYCDEKEEWRTVENDWLNAASNFALQLDSLTNNTSLALAIERIADGKVLLFPADAQLGNWLSWHEPEIKWSVKDGGGRERQVTAADLLSRTVFYKVGHHGSHNATARAQGLELMAQEDELTAFIPVDRKLALTRNPKGSWQMPARPLYFRLLQKCQGRVARADLGWAEKPAANQPDEANFEGMVEDAQWAAWKTTQQAASHVRVLEQFVEYNLE